MLTIYPILALVRRSAVHDRLLARELSVEQQCRVIPGGPPEITDELKTESSRRVLPLPGFAVAALARHIELFGLGPPSTLFFTPRAACSGGAGRSTSRSGRPRWNAPASPTPTVFTACGTPVPPP